MSWSMIRTVSWKLSNTRHRKGQMTSVFYSVFSLCFCWPSYRVFYQGLSELPCFIVLITDRFNGYFVFYCSWCAMKSLYDFSTKSHLMHLPLFSQRNNITQSGLIKIVDEIKMTAKSTFYVRRTVRPLRFSCTHHYDYYKLPFCLIQRRY